MAEVDLQPIWQTSLLAEEVVRKPIKAANFVIFSEY